MSFKNYPRPQKVEATTSLNLNFNTVSLPTGPSLIPPPPPNPSKDESAFIGEMKPTEVPSAVPAQPPLQRSLGQLRSRYVLPPQISSTSGCEIQQPPTQSSDMGTLPAIPTPLPLTSSISPASVSAESFRPNATVEQLPSHIYSPPEPQTLMNPYQPVPAHWFYASKMNSMLIWWPFDRCDSNRLEAIASSASLLGPPQLFTPINAGEVSQQSTSLPVRGGRYDVLLRERQCKAVYWEEERSEVRRATWFFRPQNEQRVLPFSEVMCSRLEEQYRRAVESGTWGQKFDLPSEENEAVSDTFVFHSPQSMIQYRAYPFLNGIPEPQHSFSSSGYEEASHLCLLQRGLHADLANQLPEGDQRPVEHLVFVVHGIGSIYNLRGEGLVECVNDMRRTAELLMASHFPSASGRVEFLPVQWHSALHSEATGINNQLKRVTLRSIPKLRNYTNDTLTDILFYSSPKYCQHITYTVSSSITRLKRLFLQRNPNFAGTLSIIGHSLGSVIVFDLLSHQRNLAGGSRGDYLEISQRIGSGEEEEEEDSERQSGSAQSENDDWSLVAGDRADDETVVHRHDSPDVIVSSEEGEDVSRGGLENLRRRLAKVQLSDEQLRQVLKAVAKTNRQPTFSAGVGMPVFQYPQLGFPISACFLLGSPLPVFLTARGIDRLPNDYRLPTCSALFNIFHPFDPVAYRMETMIVPDFKPCAVLMPHHKGRKRLHLELKDNLARVGADIKSRVYESLRSTWRTLQEFASAHMVTAPTSTEVSPTSEVTEDESDAIKRVLSRLTGGEDSNDSTTMTASSEHDDGTQSPDDPSLFSSQLNQGRRIDFVLQEGPLESLNDYLFALTSHAVYWESQDCVLFILSELFRGPHRPTLPMVSSSLSAPTKLSADMVSTLEGALIDQPTSLDSGSQPILRSTDPLLAKLDSALLLPPPQQQQPVSFGPTVGASASQTTTSSSIPTPAVPPVSVPTPLPIPSAFQPTPTAFQTSFYDVRQSVANADLPDFSQALSSTLPMPYRPPFHGVPSTATTQAWPSYTDVLSDFDAYRGGDSLSAGALLHSASGEKFSVDSGGSDNVASSGAGGSSEGFALIDIDLSGLGGGQSVSKTQQPPRQPPLPVPSYKKQE
uniref:DDHD domain-containing protein n=1 Tax=Schistocephalus solidus TaxID=70667 RepID=A0A0X3PB28_SCHSO